MRKLGSQAIIIFLFPFKFPLSSLASAHPVLLEYDHWTIWYKCERKGYDAFHYTPVPKTATEAFMTKIAYPKNASSSQRILTLFPRACQHRC